MARRKYRHMPYRLKLNYETKSCVRQIEMSPLKRARSNKGSGFMGRCIGRRASTALRRGSAPTRRPTQLSALGS